jgi:hypothetical protein
LAEDPSSRTSQQMPSCHLNHVSRLYILSSMVHKRTSG